MKKMKKLAITAVTIAMLCMTVVFLTGKSRKTETGEASLVAETQTQNEKGGNEDIIAIAEGKSLVIPVSEVATDASFIKVEVDGTIMEIIAVRGSDDKIRTAFNTCQVCYGSGRGYYEQQGDIFVCQNCGNRFTVDDIEIESGGCNPWPIFEKDKTVTDESVEIFYDFLAASKEIFANWKKNYL